MTNIARALMAGLSFCTIVSCGPRGASPGSGADQGGNSVDGKSPSPATLGVHADPSSAPASLASIQLAAAAWCAKSGNVAKARSSTHASQWQSVCDDHGGAKAAFSDLLARPYTGGGSPSPVALTPIVGRNGTVTYLFGVAIKTPITARREFEQVLVKQGEESNESALIRFQGANPISVTVTQSGSDQDSHWLRGWSIDETSVQRVVVVNVRTSYRYVVDQYDMGDDQFLYLSTMDLSRETMKDYQIMMGGLDIEGAGFVVMVGHITVDDHGYSGIAKSTLQSQVQKSIQFVYNNAALAK